MENNTVKRERNTVDISQYTQAHKDLKQRVYYTDPNELNSYERGVSYTDLRCIDFALKFYNLSSIAVDIIMYLHCHGGSFKGNYSEFTKAMGRLPGAKGHTPNIRNMCLKLEEQGILIIWRNENSEKNHRPTQIDLNPEWTKLI